MEDVRQTQARENEWKKDKALMQQKIQLLDLQIQEFKVREENYKKFNDTILNAYNSMDFNKSNRIIFKEIQMSLDSYSRDLLEQKHKNSDYSHTLEVENRDLKAQVQQLENKVRDLQAKYSKEILSLEQKIEELERNGNYIDNTQYYETQLQETQQLLQREKENTIRVQIQSEKEYQSKLKEAEQQHNADLQYYKELREKEEIKNQSPIILEKTIRIKSNLTTQYLHEEQNKENICTQQPYMSFKGSPQKDQSRGEVLPEPLKGCIVTVKSKSKSQLKKQGHHELTANSFQKTRASENVGDNSQILRKKTNEMQFSNISHLNCKNSNVMEINTQNLLQASDIFKAFGQETTVIQDTSTQLDVSNIQYLIRQLQQEKSSLEYQITDLENRSPSQRSLSDRQKLKEQLKQISRELKKARNNLQDGSDDQPEKKDRESTNILKHEIRYMINKLLKAKGKLTESFASSLNVSQSHIRQSNTNYSQDKTLSNFTKQLNQARSIENFTQIISQEQKNKRSSTQHFKNIKTTSSANIL